MDIFRGKCATSPLIRELDGDQYFVISKLSVHGLHAPPSCNLYEYEDLSDKIRACLIRHSLREVFVLLLHREGSALGIVLPGRQGRSAGGLGCGSRPQID